MTTNRILDHPVLGKLENQTPLLLLLMGLRIKVLKGIRLHQHFLQMALDNYAFMKKPGHHGQFIVILGIALNVVSRSIKHKVFVHA